MDRSWYLKRLRAMGPGEIARRSGDKLQEFIWRRRYFVRGAQPDPSPTDRIVAGDLSRMRAGDAPAAASANLVQFADRLLGGEWPTFAVDRSDVTGDVDWHLDPASGKHAPAKTYAFDIPFVGGAAQFDTKYVWELSRHHQTTVLAMAFWLTGDDRYARAAVAQVQSWIRANPFLHGIHWSSGIELGLRLIAFTWTRRLLDGWPPVRNHFEEHEEFSRCVFLHQWVLAHRHSHGSSANNHLLYEMAGLFISCCAMPWHENAVNWRKHAATILELEFPRQVFPSGYTRELASDYNGFVLEGLLLCLAETRLSGCDLAPRLTECARRMSQWLAEYSDCGGHPPRQGDSDDASGFLLDAPEYDRWRDVADWSGKWFGLSSSAGVSLRAYLFAPLSPAPNLPAAMSDHVATGSDSGLSILRARRGTDDEIYCVFDAGPLGYLSTAAHGHADALAIELRYGGVPVLVDPGTYSYRGPWRDYFRSTAAHNTIELGGVNQSWIGGPFLWVRHARARLLECAGVAEDSPVAHARAEHDGYLRCSFQGRHRRSVTLERQEAKLTILDEVSLARRAQCRVLFHLHPSVGCTLRGTSVELRCGGNIIRMELPAALHWRDLHGGEIPGAGWYSPSYDVRLPTTTLAGETVLEGQISLATVVWFPRARPG